jgi:2-amino-4-hydroxy-6-hydroxymethyldihydropteridine diphosphokinase
MSSDLDMVEAYIALGSNLGDSIQLLRDALDRMGGWSDRPLRRSSFWVSEPEDCPPGSSDFVNAVAGLIPRAGESPEGLLEKMQALERELGRKPKRVANEPRPLDLDLIVYGSERRSNERLVLPHPRAHRRRFVLAPLSEIAPELVLPGQDGTVGELMGRLGLGAGLRRLEVV